MKTGANNDTGNNKCVLGFIVRTLTQQNQGFYYTTLWRLYHFRVFILFQIDFITSRCLYHPTHCVFIISQYCYYFSTFMISRHFYHFAAFYHFTIFFTSQCFFFQFTVFISLESIRIILQRFYHFTASLSLHKVFFFNPLYLYHFKAFVSLHNVFFTSQGFFFSIHSVFITWQLRINYTSVPFYLFSFFLKIYISFINSVRSSFSLYFSFMYCFF